VIWDELDYLILDLPPATGEIQEVLANILIIDGVIIVTIPHDLSLMDAGRSTGLFLEAGIPVLGVVENMSYITCPHCKGEIELFKPVYKNWPILEKYELLGRIPHDRALAKILKHNHFSSTGKRKYVRKKIFRSIALKIEKKLQ
jgi:ATP-binding protein involved in chromosome partitioning